MRKNLSPIPRFRNFLLGHFSQCTVDYQDIRQAVKDGFPDLCDDTQLCPHEFPHRPEWEHQVRQALDYEKNKAKRISQRHRGEYTFP